MDTPSTTNYTFSTRAYWAIKGLQLAGTLGLTAAGRLEFTLDDGKQILSVPVALTKRRYMFTGGWVVLVAGPQLYTLQFYKYTRRSLGVGSDIRGIRAARAGDVAFKNWREKLEQAAGQPADNQPLVVATLPAYMDSARADNRNRVGQLLARTLIAVTLIAVAGLIVSIRAGGGSPTQLGVGIAIILLGSLASYLWLRRLQRHGQSLAPTPSPSQSQLLPLPQELLPAGTLPSRRLSPSTATQMTVTIVITVGLLILIGVLSSR